MKDKNIYLSHGYYFMHSFEICLVGYKNEEYKEKEFPNFFLNVTNNIIFSDSII